MAYCGPNAIPLAWFEGGPFRWDERSRIAALAWQANEADRCNGCGQYHSEWLRDDGDGPVEFFPRPAKVVTDYCPSCADRDRASKLRDLGPGERLAWAPNLHPDDEDDDTAP